MGIWPKLRERRIPQIVGGFAAGGWILLEAAAQLVERSVLPELAYQLVLVFFLAGLPASLLVAWFHGRKGPQIVLPCALSSPPPTPSPPRAFDIGRCALS